MNKCYIIIIFFYLLIPTEMSLKAQNAPAPASPQKTAAADTAAKTQPAAAAPTTAKTASAEKKPDKPSVPAKTAETDAKSAAGAAPSGKSASPAAVKKETEEEKKAKALRAAEEKKKKKEEFEKKADLKKAEWIEKTMEFGIQKDRKEAINFIPTVEDPVRKQDLIKKLLALIEVETDASILVKSMNIIAELNITEAAPAIRKRIDHTSEDVRIAAVYTLKDLKTVDAKTQIFEKLKNEDFTKDSNFTESMIQTLAEFKAVEMKDFAIEKIKDNRTTKNLRLSLLLFLGRSGATESKDFLIKTFSDPDEEMDLRAYSVNSISKLEIKEALPAINKVVAEINAYPFNKKKEYTSLYMYCISALVKLGDANAYPILIESLKSDSHVTRIRSIKLLKDLKDKRSIDILKYKMKYDPSLQVQKEAKEALKAMGEKIEDETDKKEIPSPDKKDVKETAPAAPQEDPGLKKREDF